MYVSLGIESYFPILSSLFAIIYIFKGGMLLMSLQVQSEEDT
jgi:hypothetical protein